MQEFVGFRAKMYTYKVDEKVTKKAKGVKQKVVERNIAFDNYT